MSTYIIILGIIFIFAILNAYITNKIQFVTKAFVLEFFLLFLLSGLRYEVGFDYGSYKDLYSCSSTLYEMKELGFIIFIEIFNKLHLPFELFILTFSGLTVFFAFRFILKFSPYVFISILIYYSIGNFYFSSFNAVRQALATAIFFNAFIFIQKRQFLRYSAVILLISVVIHASAILLLPIYFYLTKEWKFKHQAIMAIITFSFSSVLVTIIQHSPYAAYLKFDVFADAVPPTYYFLGLISLLTFGYAFSNKKWANNHTLILNINYIAFVLIVLDFIFENTPLVMVLNRLLGYFTLIYIVLIPMLLSEIKLFHNKIIAIIITCSLFFSLAYLALDNNGKKNQMVPYKTFFTE